MQGLQRLNSMSVLRNEGRKAFALYREVNDENNTIMASKYQLYLPSEKQLAEQLKIELNELDLFRTVEIYYLQKKVIYKSYYEKKVLYSSLFYFYNCKTGFIPIIMLFLSLGLKTLNNHY